MIELEHVSRKFGNFYAVHDVSFSIKTGEIVGLLGPNGAGKTTTMRMITGFLEASEGSIKIDGMDVSENQIATKRKIGYMPESAPLYSEMIVADYLEYVANMLGVDPKEKVPHLASVCGLKEVMHKNIGELSRGNKQRVGLAHALMGDPEILILDEPTVGLDPKGKENLMNLLVKLQNETHKSIVMITHDMNAVAKYAKRVIVMNKGFVVFDGTPQELFNNDELLERHNLSLPECGKYAKSLKEKGLIEYNNIPLTKEELLKVIMKEESYE